MPTNLWAEENIKALKACCEKDLTDLNTDALLAMYLSLQAERRATTAKELAVFKALLARFSDTSSGGDIRTKKFQCKIKKKLNTKVNHSSVADILRSEAMSPVSNFGVNPFRVKYEVDKDVMERLRKEEPAYFEAVIAPTIEVSPGKPGLDVVYTGEGGSL